MKKHQILSLISFVLFAVWTFYLCKDYNYLSFFPAALSTGPGIQVATDLTISITLVLIWMYFDARRTARKYWPYFVGTVLFGSFVPLIYISLKKDDRFFL